MPCTATRLRDEQRQISGGNPSLLHTARVDGLLRCSPSSQQRRHQSPCSEQAGLGTYSCQQVVCSAGSKCCRLRCQQLRVAVAVVEAHLGCLLLQLLRSLVEAVHHAGQQAHIPL